MNQPKQNPQPSGQQQIKIADNIPGAEYANAMQVSHNKDEFQIMFLNIMGPTGKVVGKIITSPGHLKRIVSAFQDNVKKYEERFGIIEAADSPNEEIGFKV
jgi:hypothetical protein